MGQILLHIGAPKCGSTYLQRVLLKNRRTLTAHGFAYPHSGQGHPGNGLMIGDITSKWLTRAFAGADTVILSHETLFSEPKRAKRLRALTSAMGINVRLFALMRPFSEIVFGDISQALKQNFSTYAETAQPLAGRTFRQFVWARHKDFAADDYLEAWADAFPDHPLILASSAQIPAALQDALPGLPTLDWTLPKWRGNPSLPAHRCEEAMAYLQMGEAEQAKHRLQQPPPDIDWARTNARESWIEEVFASRNAALLARHGFDNRLRPT